MYRPRSTTQSLKDGDDALIGESVFVMGIFQQFILVSCECDAHHTIKFLHKCAVGVVGNGRNLKLLHPSSLRRYIGDAGRKSTVGGRKKEESLLRELNFGIGVLGGWVHGHGPTRCPRK